MCSWRHLCIAGHKPLSRNPVLAWYQFVVDGEVEARAKEPEAEPARGCDEQAGGGVRGRGRGNHRGRGRDWSWLIVIVVVVVLFVILVVALPLLLRAAAGKVEVFVLV